MVRLLVWIGVVLLAAYPMHLRYPNLELQEHFPRNAVIAIVERNWEPFGLHHGSGFVYLLRVVYFAWYAAGHLAGSYPTRLDFLAAFVRDPFPFILVGRALVLASALATAALVVRLGDRLFGRAAGTVALLLLGVTLVYVREVHHVWIDVPAAALALASSAVALRLLATGRLTTALGAGVLGGAAFATKHSMFPTAAPLVLAAVLGPWRGWRRIAARLAAAGGAMGLAFLTLSPYVVIRWRDTIATLRALNQILFERESVVSLGILRAVDVSIGWGIMTLAAIGLVVAARTHLARTAVVGSFLCWYFYVVAGETLLYVRHLAPLAPFLALYGGNGAVALSRWIAPRRPTPVLVLVVGLAAAAPAWQCVQFDRLLGRTDTRQLAGEWLRAHVPRGTHLALPNAVRYPNPVLPPDGMQVQLEYQKYAAALRARGLGDPAEGFAVSYLGFFDTVHPRWPPGTAYVVEAFHPLILAGMNFPAAAHEALRAAEAVPVVRFNGTPEPLPPGVVYDRLDADYLPLTGAAAIERPGPNITVWKLPDRAAGEP